MRKNNVMVIAVK